MLFRKAVVYALCLAVFNLGSPLAARAEIVGTLQAVESGTRAQDLVTVTAALTKAAVLPVTRWNRLGAAI